MALDKKEIALSVFGVLAGLTLTYLLYRLQQRDSAASASTADANAAAVAAQDEQNQEAQNSQEYQLSESLPSVSVPSISTGSVVSSSTSSNVDTSGATADNGSGSGNDINSLLSTIIADYGGQNTTSSSPTIANLVLPSINDTTGGSLNDIPTTYAEVTAGLPSVNASPSVNYRTAGNTVVHSQNIPVTQA